MKKNNSWFTLVEILIWILIFTIILIGSFQVLSQLGIARAKLMIETNIEKKAFYFSEKLFEEIKAGWLIDYEEYFNRKVFNNNSPKYLSWHYKKNSWFWNFEIFSYYRCRSWSWTSNKMLTEISPWVYKNEWCYSNKLNTKSAKQEGKKQIYWEYALQFVDYNSDANSDWDWLPCTKPDGSTWTWAIWDSNCDWNLTWDNDDQFLGRWPEAFELNKNLTELYLISADKKHRTFFRWTVKQDPNINFSCDNPSSDWITYTWWCLWTIEFLKLDWRDWWDWHNYSWYWVFDWYIDTWLINSRFSGKDNTTPSKSVLAWSWTEEEINKYWQPLFDDSINVENVKFFLYPNKDTNLTWKENNPEDTAPYLKLQMILKPSWKTRKQIKWKIPEIPINMTISLSDVLSN